jgi:hypothetical protein
MWHFKLVDAKTRKIKGACVINSEKSFSEAQKEAVKILKAKPQELTWHYQVNLKARRVV